MKEWLISNYLEVILALGFGGSGGLLSKHLIEKQKSNEISKIKSRMKFVELKLNKNDLSLKEISNHIEMNNKLDNQLRNEINSNRIQLDIRLKGIEESQTKLFDYIVEIFKNKK